MFLTLSDKLSMVLLYLAFFGVLAYQDAGLDAIVAQTRAPQALLAGLPGERTSLTWLEAELDPPGVTPDSRSAYLLAWTSASGGQAVKESWKQALADAPEGRAQLLLAELLLRGGTGVDVEPQLAAAVRLDPDLAVRVEAVRDEHRLAA